VEAVEMVYSRRLRLPLRINLVDRAMYKEFPEAEVNKEKHCTSWQNFREY
jgi:hypothetical protein